MGIQDRGRDKNATPVEVFEQRDDGSTWCLLCQQPFFGPEVKNLHERSVEHHDRLHWKAELADHAGEGTIYHQGVRSYVPQHYFLRSAEIASDDKHMGGLRCKLCSSGFFSELQALDNHLGGKGHQQKERQAWPPQSILTNKFAWNMPDFIQIVGRSHVTCKICECSCHSLQMLQTHLISDAHTNGVTSSDMDIGPVTFSKPYGCFLVGGDKVVLRSGQQKPPPPYDDIPLDWSSSPNPRLPMLLNPRPSSAGPGSFPRPNLSTSTPSFSQPTAAAPPPPLPHRSPTPTAPWAPMVQTPPPLTMPAGTTAPAAAPPPLPHRPLTPTAPQTRVPEVPWAPLVSTPSSLTMPAETRAASAAAASPRAPTPLTLASQPQPVRSSSVPWAPCVSAPVPAQAQAPARQLPPGWRSAVDGTSKNTYYYNRQLNKTQWDFPSDPTPAPTAVSTIAATSASTQAAVPNVISAPAPAPSASACPQYQAAAAAAAAAALPTSPVVDTLPAYPAVAASTHPAPTHASTLTCFVQTPAPVQSQTQEQHPQHQHPLPACSAAAPVQSQTQYQHPQYQHPQPACSGLTDSQAAHYPTPARDVSPIATSTATSVALTGATTGATTAASLNEHIDLPPGWKACTSTSGSTVYEYFADIQASISLWDPPKSSSGFLDSSEPPLARCWQPHLWHREIDENNCAYWYCDKDSSSRLYEIGDLVRYRDMDGRLYFSTPDGEVRFFEE